MPEESARRWLPCPPKIKTHLPQRLQRRREDGSDIVRLKSRHANRWMKNGGDLINLERPSGQEHRIQQVCILRHTPMATPLAERELTQEKIRRSIRRDARPC